jgi:hypothetical protein
LQTFQWDGTLGRWTYKGASQLEEEVGIDLDDEGMEEELKNVAVRQLRRSPRIAQQRLDREQKTQ